MNIQEWNAVRHLVAKVKTRLMGLVTRARVSSSSVTGQGQIVSVGMLQGETRDGAEMFEPYGIAGAVPVGSEGVALCVGGSRDHIAVVCASPKGSTPDGREDGEVDVYSIHGQFIRLHTNGDISLQPGTGGTVYTGGAPDPTMPAANRNGDNCVPSAAMIAWAAQVTALVNSVPGAPPAGPLAGPIATTVATATKTRVS